MEGKVALVTGSTTGIGQGIANHLADKGCSIILTGFESQEEIFPLIEEFKSKYKSRTDFITADLKDPNSIDELCKQVARIYPDGIDILVNNAGIQHVCPVDEYPLDTWNEMIAVTLTASFLLIKNFLPKMKEKGWGRIINMSSQMYMISSPGKTPYSTVKAGLVGLTKGVALESAAYGVTCNAICPGYVNAPMVIRQLEEISEKKGISLNEARSSFFNMPPTKKSVEITQENLNWVTHEFLCHFLDIKWHCGGRYDYLQILNRNRLVCSVTTNG